LDRDQDLKECTRKEEGQERKRDDERAKNCGEGPLEATVGGAGSKTEYLMTSAEGGADNGDGEGLYSQIKTPGKSTIHRSP